MLTTSSGMRSILSRPLNWRARSAWVASTTGLNTMFFISMLLLCQYPNDIWVWEKLPGDLKRDVKRIYLLELVLFQNVVLRAVKRQFEIFKGIQDDIVNFLRSLCIKSLWLKFLNSKSTKVLRQDERAADDTWDCQLHSPAFGFSILPSLVRFSEITSRPFVDFTPRTAASWLFVSLLRWNLFEDTYHSQFPSVDN